MQPSVLEAHSFLIIVYLAYWSFNFSLALLLVLQSYRSGDGLSTRALPMVPEACSKALSALSASNALLRVLAPSAYFAQTGPS